MCRNMGKSGYEREAQRIMEATQYIKYEMRSNVNISRYVEILGEPVMSVIAWRMTAFAKEKVPQVHVYQLSDAMKARGWTLNNCSSPSCAHLCVTAINSKGARKFVADLVVAIEDVMRNNGKYAVSGGALYGAVVEMGAQTQKDEFMRTYLDVMSDLPSKL